MGGLRVASPPRVGIWNIHRFATSIKSTICNFVEKEICWKTATDITQDFSEKQNTELMDTVYTGQCQHGCEQFEIYASNQSNRIHTFIRQKYASLSIMGSSLATIQNIFGHHLKAYYLIVKDSKRKHDHHCHCQ